ncbi:MAG: ribose-phosphate diphosphokinase, partial [Halobacteriales archaeon]|nr:ribose-phosphate diphosphokinase [Halobacteriales archaeon]
VVAGSASAPFAAGLARELGATVARAEAKRFPDGEGYVRILEPVQGRDCVVVQATAPDTNLVELLLWQDALREAGARTVTTVIPYLGYARQDRVFHEGEAVSARAAARAVAGTTDAVVTVDPHKEEVLAFFGGKARSVSAVPQIAAELSRWGVDIVLAPDKGARDRAAQAAKLMGARVDHLEKTRISATEVTMQAKELDVAGARVAIVDDLIASGATMVTAAKQLKAQGARAVYAACTHGLFTGNALPRILAGGIDRVLATDTCISGPCSCDVVSAAPAVADALRTRLTA